VRSVTCGLAVLVLAGCSGKPVSTAPEPVRSPEAVSAADEAIEAKQNSDLLEEGVVASARVALGKPYLYGGTGQGSTGFDCSGLIQYAYAQQGIMLPRVSTSQATAGRAVEKSLDALSRGDILTFASQPGGSKVSHVGLYLGEGRFIHSSSSRGVMESTLSGTDPNGQWWFVRWVGARRVIGGGTDS
jgi:cell wall-associated NlpC family hydrolase